MNNLASRYDLPLLSLGDQRRLGYIIYQYPRNLKNTKAKPITIEKKLQEYPKKSFILIGDNGEEDAEVYAAIALKYPKQIERILIRKLDNTFI